MGRIKVNGKPYSSSSPLSKRNAGEEGEKKRPGMSKIVLTGSLGGGRMEACWKQVWGAAFIT